MDTEDFIKKVAKMRSAQIMHAKTLQYGYKSVAELAGKEVDKMLTSIFGEGWEKTKWA